MVSLRVDIKKKDLWLLSAIVVFLVGVGFVVAYGSGDPVLHGHDASEIEGELECVGVKSYEKLENPMEIVSYTNEEPTDVNQVVIRRVDMWGDTDKFGLTCKQENGWIITGVAHAGDAADSDTYFLDNGAYANDNDGAESTNHVTVICCKGTGLGSGGGSSGGVLSGSLCGLKDTVGGQFLTLCDGHDPEVSCPSGYTPKQVYSADSNPMFSCVKN